MASGGGEVNLSLPFDPSEDFEVVTDNPSDVGIMENLSGEMDGVLDPSETFEMIQEEHSAAKREFKLA